MGRLNWLRPPLARSGRPRARKKTIIDRPFSSSLSLFLSEDDGAFFAQLREERSAPAIRLDGIAE